MAVDYDFQVLKLTSSFYAAYPNPPYREILKKPSRAYNCIIFETSFDYYVCIPYRTEINHQHAYHFRSSARSVQHKSGLDYTKMVIVKKSEYIDRTQAIVDNDEYVETVHNINTIKEEAFQFLNDYIEHIKGNTVLHRREFQRRYSYSPLVYFHIELGL